MKNVKYLAPRITVAIVLLALCWYFSYYFLPEQYRDDQFSFIGELDAFFRVSMAVFIIFILYIITEIIRYQKKHNFVLRNNAIGFLIFLALILGILITGSRVY